MKKVGIGIIGGGLMGLEMASAFARWCAPTNVEVMPELVAVADLVEDVRIWFRRVPSCTQITADYHELLANPAVEVVYVAVSQNLY
jgi:predicted dehydrogenase